MGCLYELYRHRGAPSEPAERCLETSVGQRRRVDPARQLAQLGRCLLQLLERRVNQRGRLLRVASDLVSRHA